MSAQAEDIPRIKGGGLLARYHNDFMIPLLRRMRVRQTREFRATPDGLVFRSPRSTQTVVEETTFPLKIFVYNAATSGTPQWRMWVYYGLVNNKVPTIGGDAISTTKDAASLSLTTRTSATDYVYITGTLSAADSTLLYNSNFTGFAIGAAASIPADTTTTRNIQLGTIVWSSTSVPTAANANSHSIWIDRIGGPGADYVTWAAS